MATAQEQLLAAAAVFGIIVLLMVYNQVRPVRPRAPGADAGTVETRPAVDPRLARFVTHEGQVVGEVVAVDRDRLVLKHAGGFRAVPASLARESGAELRLEGDVDWREADAAGEAWHAANRSQAPAEVTGGTLTTSADVRNPALESMRRDTAKAGASSRAQGADAAAGEAGGDGTKA